MISIYKAGYGCSINEFYNRDKVSRDEILVKTKEVCGRTYTYAEPAKEGMWAFGGNILYTSNGIFPEFNTPLKLHDRNMAMEA